MKKFKVVIEIHIDRDRKEHKQIVVEAGNKKLASIRALSEIGKDKKYTDNFKNVLSVEEVQ